MDLAALKKKYIRAKEAYYNKKDSIMSDAKFDQLEERIQDLDPDWVEFKRTGIRVANKKTEIKLPRFMPSLQKRFADKIDGWLKINKGPYIKMDKLDGSSLLLRYVRGKLTLVATRGNGVHGGDITFLSEHLNIPQMLPVKEEIVFRCEALMQQAVFDKKWSRQAKGDAGFDNSRNMVNGLLNRMTPHKALKDIDIVVLGVFDQPLKKGLLLAKRLGFNVVFNEASDSTPSEFLAKRKTQSPYAIDGIVIAPSKFDYTITTVDKPKGIIAYKENTNVEDSADATVLDIIYQTSGFNRIVPKAKITPTEIDGVVVQHATLNNAAWMLSRKIGVGTKVKVLRSGGVIPKIVWWNNKGKIKYPDVKHKLIEKDFIALERTREQAVRINQRFVTKLGIEFLARKSIGVLYDAGLQEPSHYVKLLQLEEKKVLRFLNAKAGFGPNQSRKIYGELCRVLMNPIPLIALMNASGAFASGVGDKKLEKLVMGGFDLQRLMRESYDDIVAKIITLRGYKLATASLIATGLLDFANWLNPLKPYIEIEKPSTKKEKPKTGKLAGLVFTWTGYRDKKEEDLIKSLGGTVAKFSAKTDVLFYKPGGKSSTKIEKAGSKAKIFVDYFLQRSNHS